MRGCANCDATQIATLRQLILTWLAGTYGMQSISRVDFMLAWKEGRGPPGRSMIYRVFCFFIYPLHGRRRLGKRIIKVYIYTHAYCMDGLHQAPVYASTSQVISVIQLRIYLGNCGFKFNHDGKERPFAEYRSTCISMIGSQQMLRQSTRKAYVLHLRPG